MSVRLVKSATKNDWHTTIGATITDSATAIGLVSTASLNPSQLQVPGVLTIDKEDSTGADTPAKREYISFASISGATIAGITRGLGGSTAQGHTIGALIEETLSTTHWGDMLDWLAVEHETDGTHDVLSHVRAITVTGVSGASGLKGDVVFVPGSNVSIVAVSGASGYSAVKISAATVTSGGLSPFILSGPVSTNTYVTPALIVENILSPKSVSAVLKSPASGASLVLDVNRNGTSIFTNQDCRLSIPAGATYASTASIALTAFSPGDSLTLDIDVGSGDTVTCLIET